MSVPLTDIEVLNVEQIEIIDGSLFGIDVTSGDVVEVKVFPTTLSETERYMARLEENRDRNRDPHMAVV